MGIVSITSQKEFTMSATITTRQTSELKVKTSMLSAKGGSMSAEDRAKYQKASEQNEDLDLRFLFYNDRPIAKNSSTTFSMWAKRHGFPYSIGPEIPSQWLK